MKKWNFKKVGYDCSLTVNDNGKIQVEIGEEHVLKNCSLCNKKLFFPLQITLKINGEDKSVQGFILDDYDEIYEYRKKIIREIERKEKEERDKEYNAILNGEKKLDIKYHDGEYLQGYTVYGVGAKVVEDLQCGKHVSGWGTRVYDEFKDGDIEKMKEHYRKWKEENDKKEAEKRQKEEEKRAAYEKEKKELLDGVKWEYDEFGFDDEDGSQKGYTHKITINGKTYEFLERNLFDFGRTINPRYIISEELNEPGGLPYYDKETGEYGWNVYEEEKGWWRARIMSEDEKRAYLIVEKYGFTNRGIRM